MTASALSGSQGHRPGHTIWVRICHWLIVASVLTLAYSGVFILMAHPRLYWGSVGNDLTPALIELPLGPNHGHGSWAPPAPFTSDAGGPVSRSRIGDIYNQNGWARSLHFMLAWLLVGAGAAYGMTGLITGHFRREIVPRADEMSPSLFWQDLRAHQLMRIKPAAGGSPYGLLQKCAYVAVVFIALPTMVLTGLSMSPAVGAGWPWIPALFGGSQSARTIHFAFLCLLILFLLLHVLMVVMSGFWRQMRAMTWGR